MHRGLGWPSLMQVATGQEALMKITSTPDHQETCQVTTPTGKYYWPLKMQRGLGWPSLMQVATGQEALMKITSTPDHQETCQVTTPTGKVFDVSSPPSDRFEKWGDGCGVRVRRIEEGDEGRWRLNATGGGESMTGWIEVYVEEYTSSYAAPPIYLQDGDTNQDIELTSLDNSYCLVAQPFSESSLIPGHCRVTLDKATRAVQGDWSVLIGLPGKIAELHMDRRVAVEAERLNVGFIHDSNTNKIHLFCNILHTSKNITFCRFQKTSNSLGYNVMEGLSDGVHSYYGDGFVAKHCGMTIESPTASDYGTWRCSVGSQQWVGNALVRQTPMQALINVVATHYTERLNVGFIHDSNTNKIHLFCNILHTSKNITFCRFQKTSNSLGYNVMEGLSDGVHSYYGDGFVAKHCGMTIESPTASDYGTWRCSVGSQQWVGNALVRQSPMQALINVVATHYTAPRALEEEKADAEIRTVFVQEDRSFTVTCRAEQSLSYCWFLHPNGTQFSAVPLLDENQPFWYTGESLQTGDCGITFSHASESDSGDWVCHMGVTDQRGIELTDRVIVRVTGPLAANKKEIGVQVGYNATLYCHTSNGNRPLDYCRFLSPNYVGISIDSTVTSDAAILGRYYFTPGRSLDYGDCSLTISSVESEDIGAWTCAALINTDTLESKDDMTLFVDETIQTPRTLSQAGIVGMAVAALALVVLLAGVIWYKKGTLWRRNRGSSSTGNVPFDLMSMSSPSVPRSSNSTTSSQGNSVNEEGTSGDMGVTRNPDVRTETIP
ncbi:uncharacterized protein LOC114365140 [Ostrinia furnacalis]|uniref:uncharacterized protein LOC114365140 n=1 Tax=Ostrinia furnacalis TaxID=93504 RepID=UPI00103EC68E|nr:uncharacterized protein LOC114365140 [Ostrinia furnacalis]